jgi:nucleoside-diphosphate-sugar epimerase
VRIIVFGAGGCVGGWICEEIARRGDIDLIACVRRWASSQRLARRGIAISQFDLERATSLEPLLAGADAVINAALPPAQREADLAARLYLACTKAGVRRFVQLSSAVVYGAQTGEINEDTALTPKGAYAVGKAEMEQRLMAAASSGTTQVTILRPSIVYGPFSDIWTALYARRIVKGRWRTLGRAGEGTCNLVHAHDLARAAIIAATADVRGGPHVLNINGPEVVSWNEYIERFGDALRVAGRSTPDYLRFMGAALAAELTRKAGAWAKAYRIYRPAGTAQPLVEHAKSFVDLYPTPGELSLLHRKVRYSWDRSALVLGFLPSISLTDGLRQSADWCRLHGVG